MAIAQATRDIIVSLADGPDGPMTIREIAEQVGVSKSTVSRVLKESLDEEAKAVPENGTNPEPVPKPIVPARATKRKAVPKSVPENGTKSKVTVVEAVEITRDQTLTDMFNLLQIAKKNLTETIRVSDDSPQARNAINGATKAVTEILRELGKWCGLQESIKATAPETKPVNELTLEELVQIMEKP